jgi:adenosine deaminase
MKIRKIGFLLNVMLTSLLCAEQGFDENLIGFVMGLPKAELHLHMEGTMEPELFLVIAKRNGKETPYKDAEAVKDRMRAAYDLPSFIDMYEELIGAVEVPEDIHYITLVYYRKAYSQGVRHVEMYFDPQLHLERGMTLSQIFEGLATGRIDAIKEMEITIGFIMSFLRDRTVDEAMAVLEASKPWHGLLLGVGLDNPEVEDFPQKFEAVYAKAKSYGLRLTSHCDVQQKHTIKHHLGVINVLGVERIDHGLNVIDDPELVKAVKEFGIGSTGVPSLFYREMPGRMEYRAGAVKALLDAGVEISIHSDDPGMKRGLYVGDLMLRARAAAEMTRADLIQLAKIVSRLLGLVMGSAPNS